MMIYLDFTELAEQEIVPLMEGTEIDPLPFASYLLDAGKIARRWLRNRLGYALTVSKDELLTIIEETMNAPYTTYGPVRGWCGHKHMGLESAVKCLGADSKHTRKGNPNAYSDRYVTTHPLPSVGIPKHLPF